MNLAKKKILIARTLGVGKGRVILNTERLADIKEALTKQDIKDLFADKAISIREISGRKKVERRKTRRRQGSVRKKIKGGKREYILFVRRMRAFIQDLRIKGKISEVEYQKLRKEIKARIHKNTTHIRERIAQLQK